MPNLASTSPTGENNEAFLADLHKVGIGFADPAQAVSAGQAVCAHIHNGMSGLHLIKHLQENNPALTENGAAQFATISAKGNPEATRRICRAGRQGNQKQCRRARRKRPRPRRGRRRLGLRLSSLRRSSRVALRAHRPESPGAPNAATRCRVPPYRSPSRSSLGPQPRRPVCRCRKPMARRAFA